MKFLKKNLILVLAFIITFSVVFASHGATDSGVSDYLAMVKEKYGGTKLTVAAPTGAQTSAIEEMLPEFEEATNITVNMDVTEETYMRQKVLLDATSGAGLYDLIFVDAFYLTEYVDKELVSPLDSYLEDENLTPSWFEYEDIVPAYRNGIASLGDTPYGIPVAGEGRFVAYRKDLFEEYDKAPPETMEDFLRLAKFFNDEVPDVHGVTMRAKKGIHFTSGWMTMMYQMGGRFIDPETGKITIDKEETCNSLKTFIEILKQGPKDINTYGPEENISAFMSGNAAMWFDTTAWASWIVDSERSKVADKVGFVGPPEGPDGYYGALAGWDLGIPPSADDKEAAWAFIVWLLGKPNHEKYIKAGAPPLRRSALDDPELIEEHPYFPAEKEALKAANNLVEDGVNWIPRTPWLFEALTEMGRIGSEALIGNISVEKACSRMQKEVERIKSES